MPVALLTLLIALAIFMYGLTSRKNEQLALTPAMLFTSLGIVLGMSLSGGDHSSFALPLDNHSLQLLSELTLALVLFTDASRIERSHLLKFEILPIRLLAIGLPLTVLAGTAIAWWLFPFAGSGESILMALLLALLLAPTDAALSQNVLSRPTIKESLRHSLTVESGLNDGLILPVLLFTLALLTASMNGASADINHWRWLGFIGQQFTLAILVGIFVGLVGGWLVERAVQRAWMTPLYQRLTAPALALLAYSGAEVLGGNGFIAVFLAGLFLRAHHTKVRQRLKEFGEAEGQLLSLLVFVFFGLWFVPAALPHINLLSVLYALLSLTLIRAIPVLIALTGSGLPMRAKLFLAWYGPRGIASILYLLLVSTQLDIAHTPQYQEFFATVVLTILGSIFLHGASARLLINSDACARD